MKSHVTLPLNTPEAHLEKVGGKGANLARLARAGFPVPPGFLVTTTAYRKFVTSNKLSDPISSRLQTLEANDPTDLRQASDEIRASFRAGKLPNSLASSFRDAYQSLNGRPVAVRSSATAEDLPDFSFAGQQDTYLNILGEDSLLEAIVNCWGSLWTARAIGYRARNHIPHKNVSLAVVVQELVPSDVSGVLFTANPLTGNRGETVIDATLGLGEALVGGHVEPDHFVVDSSRGEVLHQTIGKKALVMRPDPAGGLTEENGGAAADQITLSDSKIRALDELGRRVEKLYDTPQDIEWAIAENEIYLLQSRPITSLYPVPEAAESDHPHLYFSFASVQGVMGPITPLGQDAIRLLFAGAGELFDVQATHQNQVVIQEAGHRLWVNLTGMVRHPLGYRLIKRMITGVDPGAAQAINTLADDPQFMFGKGRMRWSTVRRVAHFARPVVRRIYHNMRHPDGKAKEIERLSHQEIERVAAEGRNVVIGPGRPSGFAQFFRQMRRGFIFAVPNVFSGVVPGLISLLILHRLAKRLDVSPDLILEITRGLPNNVTTEMDLDLWETARVIRRDPAAFDLFEQTTSDQLAELYQAGRLPSTAQEAVAVFLKEYGMRGVGEIDFGRPRWRENPASIMQSLQSYLKIDQPELAPSVVFKRGEAAAEEAATRLEEAARGSFGGRFKARLVRALVRRARALAGLRESPKFHIIRLMGVIRERLLAAGAQLAALGEIEQADDLLFLTFDELVALDGNESRDWKRLIAERRDDYQREMGRKQIPRILISDGRAFYEGILAPADGSGGLAGSPVSPGVSEGVVRIVFDPHDANLQPGEILVCEGTDPAWTPLFLAAGGLIMEVGGLMTHGAIVAREYGIPAVVGVDQATSRLQTGQRVRVDGSSGQITLLEP